MVNRGKCLYITPLLFKTIKILNKMDRKNYDFKKAKQLIEERKESIVSAALGMHEDWFWTADTVFENGEYTKDLDTVKEIMGIDGSHWATPTLQICYKDETEDMVEVSIGEQSMSFGDKVQEKIYWTSGCLSSNVQENITPLSQPRP